MGDASAATPPPQTGLQLIDIAQHLLHIEVGVFVLGQAGGSFQQREVNVIGHQRRKIIQRRGAVKREIHACHPALRAKLRSGTPLAANATK
jgi:hypothetical protein